MCICGAVDTPQWLMSKLFKEVSFEINGQSQCIKIKIVLSILPSVSWTRTHPHVALLGAITWPTCGSCCLQWFVQLPAAPSSHSAALTAAWTPSAEHSSSQDLTTDTRSRASCCLDCLNKCGCWVCWFCFVLQGWTERLSGSSNNAGQLKAGSLLFLNWIKFDGGLQEIYVTDIVGIVWQTTISAGFKTYIPQRLMKSCCVSFVLSL